MWLSWLGLSTYFPSARKFNAFSSLSFYLNVFRFSPSSWFRLSCNISFLPTSILKMQFFSEKTLFGLIISSVMIWLRAILNNRKNDFSGCLSFCISGKEQIPGYPSIPYPSILPPLSFPCHTLYPLLGEIIFLHLCWSDQQRTGLSC